jgi:hypothetical protein
MTRRRGVIRSSITRLANRLSVLESKSPNQDTLEAAQQTLQRLNDLQAEFKVLHFELIDVIEDEKALEKEQEVFDMVDEQVDDTKIRIKKIIHNCSCSMKDTSKDELFFVTRKLSAVKGNLDTAKAGIAPLTGKDGEIHLIRQYEDEISEMKRELSDIYDSLLQLRLDESHSLCILHSTLKGEFFESSLKLKELTYKITAATSEAVGSGVRLPKLETPKFDGNLLNWRVFWEQFKVSVHERNIPDSEKLVYLQSALKDGTAKGVIEGLSRSGEFYCEAIESLHARYDRPRLLHQTHVRMIMDAPALRDGNGKEVRRLHDVVQQHLRALKALGNEPSGPFVTSMLELKLDTNTAFEWHKYSQDSEEVPHYSKLLEFLNLRAQASEAPNVENKRNSRNDVYSSKKSNNQGSGGQKSHFTSLASSVSDHTCVVCREKHPLYACMQSI